MTVRAISGVRRAGRVARLREQIEQLRRQQYGPAITVRLYVDDDSPAYAQWIQALDTGIHQAAADTAIVTVNKLAKRPATLPPPWAAQPPTAQHGEAPPWPLPACDSQTVDL